MRKFFQISLYDNLHFHSTFSQPIVNTCGPTNDYCQPQVCKQIDVTKIAQNICPYVKPKMFQCDHL